MTDVSRRNLVWSTSKVLFNATVLNSLLGAADSALALPSKGVHTWVSPRGTIQTMDDYPYWVAREMGYFEGLGLYTKMEPGGSDGAFDVKALATSEADIGSPAPGTLAFAVGNRIDLVSVYSRSAQNIYNLAFRKGQGTGDLRQLEGKTVLLGASSWQLIADPMFAAAGVDPKSIKYVEAGWPTWVKALHGGYGDAALTWEGLRAELEALGLRFDYWMGLKGSRLPSGSLVVRRSELLDPDRRAFLQKYLRGWAMATEFAERNPKAAAQIVFKALPLTRQRFGVRYGTESLLQVHRALKVQGAPRSGWGEHDLSAWDDFFLHAKSVGLLGKNLDARKHVLNDLIVQANVFDKDKVRADADRYPLSAEMQALDLGVIERSLYASAVN